MQTKYNKWTEYEEEMYCSSVRLNCDILNEHIMGGVKSSSSYLAYTYITSSRGMKESPIFQILLPSLSFQLFLSKWIRKLLMNLKADIASSSLLESSLVLETLWAALLGCKT